jgi:hypothetical protein
MHNTFNCIELSQLFDSINVVNSYSCGVDGDSTNMPLELYVIIEKIFEILGKRYDVMTIKVIKDLEDPLAFEWHTDNTTETEVDVKYTVLVYLPGCEGSTVGFLCDGKETFEEAAPYKIVIFDTNTVHKGIGSFHRNFIKITLK